MSAPPVGIDLATTYSCIAVFENGHPVIIPNLSGEYSTPSVVAFEESEPNPLVGRSAKNSLTGLKLYDSKRLIGRRYDDPAIQSDFTKWPFKVVNDNGRPKYSVTHRGQTKLYAPEEISAQILMELKKSAEAYLGKPITDAVITVPSYFNDQQRSATKDAAKIAGINVLRLVNEPTAVSLNYFNKEIKEEKTILITDVGGGTSDFTVLTIDEGVFEVLSTCGDSHLGGQDLDNAIVDYLIEEFKRKNKINLQDRINAGEPMAIRALNKMKRHAEEAKIALTSRAQVPITIESLYDGIDLSTSMTRARFEEMNKWFFEKCVKCIEQALKDANKSKNEIHDVVLAGGTTLVPKFQEIVSHYFGGKELCKSVNPHTAICSGACIQASILMKDVSAPKNLLLLDVCPLSLGVEEGAYHRMHVMVPRNTTIPCKKSTSFVTGGAGQDIAEIVIYEGERPQARENKRLGSFQLAGLVNSSERDHRGHAKVEITFDLDANGMLSVLAKSGTIEKKIEIKDSTRHTQQEIDEMIRNAEKFREADLAYNEKVTAINELQSKIWQLPEDKRQSFDEWLRFSEHSTLEQIREKISEVDSELASSQNPESTPPPNGPVVTEVD